MAAGPASAQEQLVMPFDCRAAGGHVMLAPSAPQAYPIYGRREQKRLTTCSPYDASKCHNWSVYRFDINCGGVRTSWESVVAALAPMLQDSLGSLNNAKRYRGLAYAPPGGATPGRDQAISFPPGFAPNPMKVASFTGTRPPPPPAVAPLPPKKPDAPEPTQVAGIEPSLEPTAPEPATAAPSTESKEETAAAPVDIRGSQEPIEVAEERALQIDAKPEVTGSLPASSSATSPLWPQVSTVFMWTIAVLFALTATLLLGRRRMLERLPMPTGFLLLRGPAQPPAVRTPDPEPDPEAVRQKEATASRLRLWDEEWLPRTTLEALDVLGVDPDASRDKMKVTVTRLRRALHPDHAIDEEDRLLRERRLKQINVAWDIISGKRRVPWLKQTA